MKKIKRLKKFFKSVFIILVALALSFATLINVSAAEPTVTLTVTIDGLTDGDEADITVQKEEDGLITWTDTITASDEAIFTGIPVGGSCTIIPEQLAGYTNSGNVTVQLQKLQGVFEKSETVTYSKSEHVDVTGITMEQSSLRMLVGDQVQLDAAVIPENATNQVIMFSSGDENIATVSSNGLVTAVAYGEALITATTNEGSFEATCSVKVGEVDSIESLDPIYTTPGTSVALPQTVSAELDYPGEAPQTAELAVTWDGAATNNTVVYFEAGTYVLAGDVDSTDLEASLTIEVEGDSVDPATNVVFDKHNDTIYLDGETVITIVTVIPEGASLAGVMWRSSDTRVATVEKSTETTATVFASATNTGIVNIEAYIDNGEGGITVLDICTISVVIDPTIVEDVRIVATDGDTNEVEVYDSPQDVYISAYGLDLVEYNVKITDSGGALVLGSGTFTPSYDADPETNDPFVFNLWDQIGGFNETNKNSQMYYVSVSKDPSYPSGDETEGVPWTLVDNFKITSPIPTGSIVVDIVEIIDGEVQTGMSAAMSGQDVILGRVLDEDAIASTQYADYLLPGSTPEDPLYSDEVKLLGHIQPDGSVLWDEPREPLKIGGYLLLIQLPNGYLSNLDQLNPDTDDGSLLKEVHITRNTTVIRVVTVNNPTPTQGEQYLVSFDANGGMYADTSTSVAIIQTNDDLYQLPLENPERTGFIFDSWNTQADGLGTTITSGDVVDLDSATTLYAKWTELSGVTMIYLTSNVDYGTVSLTSETVNPESGNPNGSTASALSGYHFVKWVDESNNTVSTSATLVPTKNSSGLHVSGTYTAIFAQNETDNGSDPTPGAPVSDPTIDGWPNLLKYGSIGTAVKQLQQLLTFYGHPLVADGIFGPKTQNAVKAFQGGNGLVPDGIVGPLTRAALKNGSTSSVPVSSTPVCNATIENWPTLRYGSAGTAVRQLQQLLTYYGYPLVDDGIFGPKTLAAVKAFQSKHGLVADGIVGPLTKGKLKV